MFDGAAMGQYLGGVDPRNIGGDSRGFVNETCVIKYNQYTFHWMGVDGLMKPFLQVGCDLVPIFNLHIHSKRVKDFIGVSQHSE